ncbi:hypothetical protein AB0P05_43175 [Streptomyces flaveolus]|uniref:hypothetical protein n=1 Tax=Streptomyces flaveolus TaxID=67297 RepID=UPI0034359806
MSWGLDLTELDADGTADIVMPTVVVVDAGGVLPLIDLPPNYTTPTELAQVLKAAAQMLG